MTANERVESHRHDVDERKRQNLGTTTEGGQPVTRDEKKTFLSTWRRKRARQYIDREQYLSKVTAQGTIFAMNGLLSRPNPSR